MFSKMFHDAALHVLARREHYQLTETDIYEIGQVANGYIGAYDVAAGHRGITTLRRLMREAVARDDAR